MAGTREGRRLSDQYRAEQLAIRAQSLRGLLDIWKGVKPADLSGTIDTFTTAAVLLALDGYDDAALSASRYLPIFRRAEGIRGEPPAVITSPGPARVDIAANLRGAALSGIITARRAGMSTAKAADNGLVKVAGALAKIVLTGGWMTILSHTQRDPVALGWQRVTSGDPCAFCRMLAGRGPVYKSEGAADFTPHDGCGCTAEPVYRKDGVDPQAAVYREEYAAAQRWAATNVTRESATSNNQLNNYRQWLAKGKPEPGDNAPGGGTEESGE